MTSEEDRPSNKRARVSNVSNDHDIPLSSHYQVSYAHKAVVTFVEYSLKHDMVLTASQDGIIKFWKRTSPTSSSALTVDSIKAAESYGQCVEFIKSYIAHTAPPTALTMSQPDGDVAASVGEDNIIKFYDVGGFDVSGMIRIAESYQCGGSATFVGEDQTLLAVSSSSKSSGSIFIFSSITLAPIPVKEIKLHAATVVDMRYNYPYQCVVSVDKKGVIEYWNGSMKFSKGSSSVKKRNLATLQEYDTVSDDHDSSIDKDQQDMTDSIYSPLGEAPTAERNGIELKSKMDTDLLTLLRKKTHAVSLSMSPTGSHFVVYAADRKVRLFHFESGKVVVQYDERMKTYDAQVQKKFSAGELAYKMDSIDYGNRVAREREIADTTILNRTVDEVYQECGHQNLIVKFDPSGKLLILPTMVGLKVIDWSTNKCRTIIGMGDSATLRFIGGCLCLGPAKIDKQMQLARSAALGGAENSVSMQAEIPKNDSILITMAFNKRRFYIFSQVDPVGENGDEAEQNDVIISRDIMNEPPDADDLMLTSMEGHGKKTSILGTEAILRTTKGDIHIRLYPNETPRTVENFCTHSKNGYYDNVIFHRVIKGFMIQTGDPLGDGTGGESIWGNEFEDECVRELRHDRPFTVSMANAGPNTNGSQFFITTVPTPWLDNKHTVFGRVIRGMDVCTAIENVKTDEMDKPLNEVSIMSIDVV